jgi:hypothetical protein
LRPVSRPRPGQTSAAPDGAQAAEWQRVIAVGDVTQVTIDLSKDNVFFGIRAVNRDGLRSPVAFPKPGS